MSALCYARRPLNVDIRATVELASQQCCNLVNARRWHTAVMCWSKNSGWLPAAKQSIVAWRVGPSPGGWMQYLPRSQAFNQVSVLPLSLG